MRVPSIQISRATFCSNAGYGNATTHAKSETTKFEYHEYGVPKEEVGDESFDPVSVLNKSTSEEQAVAKKKKKTASKVEKKTEKDKETSDTREKLNAGDQNAMRDFSMGA